MENKLRSIVINKEDANQRIDKFLIKFLKSVPPALIYKYIRKKRIKVNDKRCDFSYKLSEGDVLNLYINDELFLDSFPNKEFLEVSSGLNIVYEDKNILILDKPPGIVVHPDENFKLDCLINRVKKYLYVKNEYKIDDNTAFSPALANRIDRNTGGIVIAAKNSEALRILNDKIKNREIKKYYLCIIHGNMSKPSDTLVAYIGKNKKGNISKISFTEKPGYKKIITKYTVIKDNICDSLLKIELITGRKHQIRAHLAAIGHPILGDTKYGFKYNVHKRYQYQALYAYKIAFCASKEPNLLDYLVNKDFQVEDVWFLGNESLSKM